LRPFDYEAKAVALANNPALLAKLRRELDEGRAHAVLFDSTRFAQDLGNLFERMFRRLEQGLPPAALPAEPST
jgi:predicted O-linked N-acetylglucosamine transferase (SPINDLY family)